MLYLWIDDVRPLPFNRDIETQSWLAFNSTDRAVSYIRRMHNAGYTRFYLDLDHDAGDYADEGGDYINILKNLEAYVNGGRMRHLDITCHFHSMNPVGVQNMKAICEKNGWKID